MAKSFLSFIIGYLTLPNLPNPKCPVSGVHSTFLTPQAPRRETGLVWPIHLTGAGLRTFPYWVEHHVENMDLLQYKADPLPPSHQVNTAGAEI